ncbi:MAG TPA: hypothetical protein VG165_03370 [Solirubrobacteraceae bacterium]|jgi:uncharacterized delta-60 repeat protein|nr:hypothetical protein [Solirubrobacteraceae bacterium]
MTRSRCALVLALAAVGGSLIPASGASAAPPAIATAPGRVVFPLDNGRIDDNDNAGGAQDPAVALPDGDIVVSAGGSGKQAYLTELQPDGAIDTSFGIGGIAQVAVGLAPFDVTQIVGQPDGKLVLAGSVTRAGDTENPVLVLVRLNADGSLDQSFGTGGVDLPPIGFSCASCLALRPGGGFFVTGTLGEESVPINVSVSAEITGWAVAGLTSTGALDPGFGQSGIATVAENGASGTQVAALPDGDAVSLGSVYAGGSHYSYELVRLLPSGAPDPAFHGGTPEYLPAAPQLDGMMVDADGSVIVAVTHAIIRYTAAGLPDPSFGTGGVVQTGPADELDQSAQLFPSAGDGALVILENDSDYGRDLVERIGATGAIDTTLGGPSGLDLETPFGGGSSSFVVSQRPRALPPLTQNTFTGSVVQRPDGSYVFLGDVAVSQPTGEGEGRSIDDFAAVALTPSFALDPAFGGPAAPFDATLAVIRQRASTARTLHGVRVTLDVSAPGLARVVIKSAGRVIAQSVLPVFVAGPVTLPVELTTFGDQWLKTRPRSRLTVTLRARDLLTHVAKATAAGRLH